jgi:trk system potassium uptake protein TrkH
MKRLLYPRGVFSIRLNNKVGSKGVVYGVAGFVFLYLAISLAATLVVSGSGLDLLSSFSLAALCLGNTGLGLGATGPGAVFQDLPALIKWVLAFVMIAGRLELWTALVFFSRAYWRQ